jgi:lysozyme family protein
MATSTYDEALRRLLIHEGGYTNHPSDPGGPTNYGITIYDYRKYVKPDAYGVNSGVGRSGKVLRRVVGLPASLGPVHERAQLARV